VSKRAVAINLKIPDNTAYTALTTLQRLGVDVARVERSEILVVDFGGDDDALAATIERDEAIFNPNKHRLTVLDAHTPRSGEVWIAEMGREKRYIGWRLMDKTGEPAGIAALRMACTRLLCNPAIEKATFPQ
jgi:phosphoribosylformylglycinamidine (FGAM) synthase PurS component